MLPPNVSSKELALVLGVTPRQVQKLAERGDLPQLGRDKFALAAGVQAHTAYKVAQVEERLAGEDQSYAEARRRKVLEEARALEDARRVREGELISRTTIDGAMKTAVLTSRSRLLNIPSKFGSLAARMIPQERVAEVAELVRKLIREALLDLSGINERGEAVPRRRHTEDVA
jgi:hypothetical protein